MGEIPQGLLVALDEKLTDIRLVSGNYDLINYDHKKTHPDLYYKNAEKLQTQLDEFASILSPQLEKVFSRLKYDSLHAFSQRSSFIRRRLAKARWEYKEEARYFDLDKSSLSDLIGFLAAQTDRAIDLHREVYDTVKDSGLAEIISEHGPKLAELPTELTLPADDLKFEERKTLQSALENSRERPWSAKNHQFILEQAEATRTSLMIKAIESPRANERIEKPRSEDSTIWSQWIGPTTRILAGTGLVAANAALGITAGLTATVATIGATSVPIYVGIATSIYTGSVQVAEGLEKIGRSGNS